MLSDQFHIAVAAVRTTAQLDLIARQLWAAHGQGAIDDTAAEAVSAALQARRAALTRPPAGITAAAVLPAIARRLRPRTPERIERTQRRRRCAASGAVPARIADAFSQAEVAALAIVAAQVREHGQCLLPLATISDRAGVSKTTTKNAIRHAIRLGLIQRIERRIRHQRSETNILRIVSPTWTDWLKRGRTGGKSLPPKEACYSFKGKKSANSRPTEASKSPLGTRRRSNATGSAHPARAG